jgi:hypothetical protein
MKKWLLLVVLLLQTLLCTLNDIGLPDYHSQYDQDKEDEKKLTVTYQDFTNDSCACPGYTVSDASPVGVEGLTCRYDWAGLNISDNKLGFVVNLYNGNHVDELPPTFTRLKQGLIDGSTMNIYSDQVVQVIYDDAANYAYYITQPGTNDAGQKIPLCGKGHGVHLQGINYLVETDINTCDMGSADMISMALTDMKNCAEQAIFKSQIIK